jgi:diguanylate cyclase (GGDEF)-like protein
VGIAVPLALALVVSIEAVLAQTATELLDRADAQLTHDPAAAVELAEAATPTSPDERVRRAVVIARGRLFLGASEQAEAALSVARPALDDVDALLRSRWLRTEASVAFALGNEQRSLRAGREALDLVEGRAPSSERVEALAVALQVALGAGEYSEALAYGSRLQQLLSDPGVKPTVRYDAQMMLATLHRDLSDPDRAAEAYRAAAETAAAIEDVLGEADARFALAQILIQSGRFDTASEELDVLEGLYREAGDALGVAMVIFEQARVALRLDEFGPARALARRARERLESMSVPPLARRAYYLEAEALLALERPGDARRLLDTLDEKYPQRPESAARNALDARLAAAVGDWEQAYRAKRTQLLDERAESERRLSRAAERARARLDFEAARLQRAELEAEIRLRDLQIEAADRQALWQRATIGLALIMLLLLALILFRQRRHGRELSQMALRDSLTGLPNRRAFFQRASRSIDEALISATPASVLMIDLDHFKAVNDRHGHDVGDRVLRDFSTVLVGAARAADLPARLGGEEFGLFLPGTDANGALLVAERLLAALRDRSAVSAGASVTLSASIGVAELMPGDSLESLLKRADEALYAAKANGRGRAEVAVASR